MTLSPTRRSFTAWLLYASLLLNVPTCGLAHGQLLGLDLSGAGIVFCSMSSGMISLGDDDASGAGMLAVKCPVCAVVLGMGLLFALAWLGLLRRPQRLRPPARSYLPHPRYLWPSANPRASPAF
ncbi:DUF2946 family protein [Pseudomonas abyssi]|uniref:DUF2946 family protein n=1 Tax=Pseudomonas abyssi TaxID=170540 RepID=UPI003C7B394E